MNLVLSKHTHWTLLLKHDVHGMQKELARRLVSIDVVDHHLHVLVGGHGTSHVGAKQVHRLRHSIVSRMALEEVAQHLQEWV